LNFSACGGFEQRFDKNFRSIKKQTEKTFFCQRVKEKIKTKRAENLKAGKFHANVFVNSLKTNFCGHLFKRSYNEI